MKFSYKFSNLLGTVYRRGNIIFTPDGNSVISPVGNRISIHDLKSHKTSTLPIESRYNFVALDLSPNGNILVAINEQGDAFMISLVSQTVTHKYRFKRKVNAIKFSPDGKHFAVCKENNVFVFQAPGPFTGQYNGFVMERVFHNFYDETTCLDWSFDSKILAVGSKDMSIKLFSLGKWDNFKTYALGGHTDVIVACFFEHKSYDITTISRNGQACIWECSIDPDGLLPFQEPIPKKKQKPSHELQEDDVDLTKVIERSEEEISKHLNQLDIDDKEENEKNKKKEKMYYKRLARHYLADDVRKESKDAVLTAASYHKATKVLVAGFSTGAFFIYELPEVSLIHSLSVSDEKISSIALNSTGDWIALGCGGLGQLLVWEWQSETYVLKQQGHSNNMSCICYSPDGQIVVTGGEDGKVKLWNVTSGFCFVTFSEHLAPVTAVSFSGNKKFIVSASLDGTVRAYDIIRYRNFRTLTTPRPVQLSCVAVDSSGEFVAAGGQDVFEVFLWSVKTGRLLEILAGHEGPVWSVAFNPNVTSTILASVSWDKTLRIWDAIEKGSDHETIELSADGLCVTFKPDGEEVAVATLDGQITTFHVRTATQTGSIEGRNDLGSGRSDTDLVTAKKTLESKAFTSLCYSADGEYLLAGGQSKNVCIYNVKEGLLVKKFEVTQNRSFDAVDDFINRRKMTEFGNLNLIEEREENEGGNVAIRLPGVKKGDMAARSFKPEVRIYSLQFSPTGEAWAAATTEGLLIYSLNLGLVFDPWDLEVAITPDAIRQAIKDDQTNALVMAVKLNEAGIIQEVIENISVNDVELTLTNLGEKFAERLLIVIASALESSRHLEFYLVWAEHLLTIHGPKIKSQKNMPGLIALQKGLTRKYEELSKLCDFNTYTMQCILRASANRQALEKEKAKGNIEGENETSSSSDEDENIMMFNYD
ncbi:periodic tryptophan protein 2 homolog [Agrilus planipennis]|uniref:Periodic tryptophan protein 2 homolog n=1 Tax=Agrilus planipennis TaxID=224129 RepID=A0A7F5R1E0_AGRPL|nr:periodic tryptophan protein 2 homolog [Agrilus planipennis]